MSESQPFVVIHVKVCKDYSESRNLSSPFFTASNAPLFTKFPYFYVIITFTLSSVSLPSFCCNSHLCLPHYISVSSPVLYSPVYIHDCVQPPVYKTSRHQLCEKESNCWRVFQRNKKPFFFFPQLAYSYRKMNSNTYILSLLASLLIYTPLHYFDLTNIHEQKSTTMGGVQ